MPQFQVIVGNIGTVYDGSDHNEALICYGEYRGQSTAGYGRAAGENVTFLRDGAPMLEHDPSQVEKPEAPLTVAERLRNELVYFEHVIYLDACRGYVPDVLWELLRDGAEARLLKKKVGFDPRALSQVEDDRYRGRNRSDRADFAEFEIGERGLTGYLVQAQTPSVAYIGKPEIREEGGKPVHGTFTWGATSSTWIYGKTMNEVVDRAIAWKDKLCRDDYNKPEEPTPQTPHES